MFKALESLMWSLQYGGQQRQVQRYLDEATPESVLLDLSRELRHAGQRGHLRTIFQEWCVGRPSRPPYFLDDANFQAYTESGNCWTAKTFQAYVESGHLGITSSEIELLWRCFVFHAYHPFPQEHDSNNARLGMQEFMRAATLLAAQGANLLGKVENCDYYLHYDGYYYRNADFRRIIRSISAPVASAATGKDLDPDVVADTVSVLTMIVPYFIHNGPTLEQLNSTARKLLDRYSSARVVPRDDLSTLLRLILRMKANNAEKTEEILSDVSLAAVLKSTSKDLTSEELSNKVALLPDIQTWFYQLWTRIFQLEWDEAAASVPQRLPSAYTRHADSGSVGGAELATRITGFGPDK